MNGNTIKQPIISTEPFTILYLQFSIVPTWFSALYWNTALALKAPFLNVCAPVLCNG